MNELSKRSKPINKSFVIAGNVHISKKEEIIWTVLGSCISVIFFIPSKQLTLFSHSQLPSKNFESIICEESCLNPCLIPGNNQNFKFVSCSTNYMIEQLKQNNVKKHELIAYLIGGASAFNIKISGSKNISDRNIEAAEEILNKLNIPYTKFVGGSKSRKVIFNTQNGELLIEEK